MNGGTIARLNAALTWDLDDFDRGTLKIGNAFDGIKAMVAGLGVAFAEAGRKMTLMVSLPLAAITGVVPVLAARMKDVENAARLAGDGFEEFQRKVHAASTVGVEMDKLADIFKDTQDKIGEFAATGAGEMKDFFDNIAPQAGVTIEMFRDLSGPDALQLYYNALVKVGVPHKEMVFYLEAIADEGSALIPLLAENGRLMRELGASAPVFTEKEIASLLEFVAAKRDLATAITKVQIALANAGLTEWMTDIAKAVTSLVERFAGLSPETQKFILKMGALVAAIGPAMVVISKLASLALPALLLGMAPLSSMMGKVLLALSSMINPMGTAFVMIGKLASEFGAFSTVIARVAPLFLRFAGPIGAAIGLFMLFRDDVTRALKDVFDSARDTLGPKLTTMFDDLGEAMRSMNAALDDLMASEFGQWLDGVIERIGKWVELFVRLGGQEVINAIGGLIDNIRLVADAITSAGEIVRKVLSGEWVEAWRQAADTVNTAVSGMIRSVGALMPGLRGIIQMMEYAGLIKPANKPLPETVQAQRLARFGITVDSMTQDDEGNPETNTFGKSYTKPSTSKKSSKGRTGPTAEELELRRKELQLQQELDVARLEGDTDAERALERQLDLLARIDDYERAGLSTSQAKAAAELDMKELDAARAQARAEALASDERQFQMQIAELKGDYEKLALLEKQEFKQREIEALKEKTLNTAEAELLAQKRLNELEAARAVATARRLEDQRAAHELELARLRGDSDRLLRAREESDRVRRRTIELQDREKMSYGAARAQAEQESDERNRAYLTGTFRDTFRNGLRAALDGNLGDFFENWLRDRSFNALADVLDRLADGLANLFSNQGGNTGGFLSTVGSAIGSFLGFGGGGGTGAGGDPIVVTNGLPFFDSGGEFEIKGFKGIDQNLLSLNGNPVARVSDGEIVNIRKGATAMGGGGGGTTNNYYTLPSDEFWSRVDGRAGNVVAQAAPAIVREGGRAGVGMMNRMRERDLTQ